MYSNFRGIIFISLPGKVYARVLERRVQTLVAPQIQEKQCGFSPGHGKTDQLFTLKMIMGFMGFLPVYMFCGLGKGICLCPLWDPVEGASGVWGTGPVIPERESGPYYQSQVRLVPGACWAPPGLLLVNRVTNSVHDLHGHNI